MIDCRAIAVTMFAVALSVADDASARSGGFSVASPARIPRGVWLLHGFRQHSRANAWFGDASWCGTSESGDDVAASGLTMDYPATAASATATSRPPCHWEVESYVVPSEPQGETKVTVTRCVSAAGAAPEGVVGRRTIPLSAH
jgi:hypothetical protein